MGQTVVVSSPGVKIASSSPGDERLRLASPRLGDRLGKRPGGKRSGASSGAFDIGFLGTGLLGLLALAKRRKAG